MRSIDVFSLAMAVLIALFSPLFEVRSAGWWIAVILSALFAFGAAWHMAWNSLSGWLGVKGEPPHQAEDEPPVVIRAQRRRMWPQIGKIVGVLVFAGITIWWLFPEQVTQRTYDVAVALKLRKPLPTPKMSTFSKNIYECDGIAAPISEEKQKEFRATWARNAKIAKDVFGISYSLSDIPGGLAVDMIPATAEAQARLSSSIFKSMRLEARRIPPGDKALITLETTTSGLPELLLLIFNAIPPDENSPAEKQKLDLVERLSGGRCHLL